MNEFTYSLRALRATVRWGFFVSVLSWSLICCYWLWWPYDVLQVQQPIEIVNKIVKAGDRVEYRIRYNKKIDINGKLTRKLINTYKLEYADATTTAPIGTDMDEISLYIPEFAHSGLHYLWWSVAYKVNPLRIITVSAESERFYVIGKDFKGDIGPPGPQGKQGEEGQQGEQGIPGKIGHAGNMGEKGLTGDKGNNFWGGKP